MATEHFTGTPPEPGALSRWRERCRHGIEFVLVAPSHPGNIGAAARALTVMGFGRLTVVAPRFADAARHPEAVAFASGATALLARTRVVADLDEALADARWVVGFSAAAREFAAPPTGPGPMAEELLDRLAGAGPVGPAAPAPVAVIFGTERTGLSIAQAQRCQRLCTIDTDPGYSSLNLAQAVQLAAYVLREAASRRGGAPARPVPSHAPGAAGAALAGAAGAPAGGAAAAEPAALAHGGEPGDVPATTAQLEGLFAHLQTMLIDIGFLHPDRPKRLMPRLRRLLLRAGPTVTEVDILRGICTRILQMRDRRD